MKMTGTTVLVMVAAIVATLGPVHPAGVGFRAPYGSQAVQSSQHHVQNPDGSYDFAYNTGEGAFRSEKKTGNLVSGQYGSQGPDGTFVNVQYQAPSTGRDTYSASQGYQGYRSSEKAFAGRGYSAPVQPKPYTAPAQPKAYPGSTYQQQSQAQLRGKAYVGGGSSGPITPAGTSLAGSGRSVVGSLGYSQPGGAAGPFGQGVQGPGGFSYSFTSGHSGAPATAGGYAYKHGAPATAGNYAYKQGAAASAYRGEQVVPNFRLGPDGSYDFDYQTSQQYRAESRGRDGSVRGQFGHASPDGVRRNYAFTSGYGGFQVTGDDLPRQPEVPRQAYGVGSGYRRHDDYSGYRGYGRYPEDESPKPFAFSYNAGDHGRSEVQDAQGVVQGKYTVNAADGTLKEVSYRADDTGFSITDEKTVGGVRAPVPAQQSKYTYSGTGGAKAGKSAYAYTGPTAWN